MTKTMGLDIYAIVVDRYRVQAATCVHHFDWLCVFNLNLSKSASLVMLDSYILVSPLTPSIKAKYFHWGTRPH